MRQAVNAAWTIVPAVLLVVYVTVTRDPDPTTILSLLILAVGGKVVDVFTDTKVRRTRGQILRGLPDLRSVVRDPRLSDQFQ